MMDEIADIHNYIQSRKRKGKTATEAKEDLIQAGYDEYAARGLIMMHWSDSDG